MSGIAGCLALAGGAKPDADWTGRATRRMAHRGPDDEGLFSDAAWPSPLGGFPLSTRRRAAISRCAPPTGGTGWSSTGRSTTTPSWRSGYGSEDSRRAAARTPRSSWRPSPLRARTSCGGCVACSRWPSGTPATTSCSAPATHSASSPCTTRARRERHAVQVRFRAQGAGQDQGEVPVYRPGRPPPLPVLPVRAAATDDDAAGPVPAAGALPGRAGRRPGRCLSATGGRCSARRSPRHPGTPERILAVLRESVAVHLRSDVPLGAFLSGGVDSAIFYARSRPRPGQGCPRSPQASTTPAIARSSRRRRPRRRSACAPART